MRAAYNDRYGPPEVVSVRTVPDPVPGPGEALVRVQSAAVTAADSRMRGARFPRGFAPLARLALGVRRPRRRILGSAFSGTVEGVGSAAAGFAVGDRVAGMLGTRLGAHAELVAVEMSRLVPVPDSVSDDNAAGVLFGGTTAWHVVHRTASVAPGSAVLVVGASGAVGSAAVQLASAAGGVVTAVCSGRNADLMRDLGAVEVVDYTQQDVGGLRRRYDTVIDCVGVLDRGSGARLVRPGGSLCLVAADLWQTITARGWVKAGVSPERSDDFAHLLTLVEDGSLRVAVSAVMGLDGIVAAHRLVDSGHKVGNIIIHPNEIGSPAAISEAASRA